VNDDFSEPNDLAAREPKKLRELQDLFWAEAAKYITIALPASILRRER
jgi:arylsulfatase